MATRFGYQPRCRGWLDELARMVNKEFERTARTEGYMMELLQLFHATFGKSNRITPLDHDLRLSFFFDQS